MHIVETEKNNDALPVSEKFMLTIKEAAPYYNIGMKKLRRLAEDNLGVFSVYSGNRYLIVKSKFEEFILNSSEIKFLLSAESSCYFWGVERIYDEPINILKTATFGRKEVYYGKTKFSRKGYIEPFRGNRLFRSEPKKVL